MISRVADHCFWFGRYLERTESTARLLQVTSSLSLDSDLTQLQCWQPVIITAGEEERFAALGGAEAMADGEAVQAYLTFNDQVPVCLSRSIAAARENARSVREVVSLEVWESINELHLWIQSPAARAAYDDHRYGFYRHIRKETQLCMGLLRGCMLHDAALDFIWLGLLLERIGQTARILDVHHHALTVSGTPDKANAVVEVAVWLSLLRACYGFEAFMKTHRGVVTGETVASFLIFEGRFPRAVIHCVRRAREGLEQIRPTVAGRPPLKALSRLKALEAKLDARAAAKLDASEVHELLTAIVDETQAACEEVGVDLLSAQPIPSIQAGSEVRTE
ncbi:MAG: alpha-E domain-containing protein [Myxococcales bacterium]